MHRASVFTVLARLLGAARALHWLVTAMLFAAMTTAYAQPFNPDPTQKWKNPDWMPGGKAAIVTPELRDGRVYQLTPAQIIYYSAKENGVNPLLLLVKIQAEQSLIKQTFDAATLERKLSRVVGYGIPERDIFLEKWPGYYPQLVGMSYEFWTMAKKKDFHSAFLEYTPHEDKYTELVNMYQEYAPVLNRVAGKNYPARPQSSGYLYDFRDVNADHIQSFLDNYAGPLKNKQLFAGGGTIIPAPNPLPPNFNAPPYSAAINPLVQAGYGGQCTAFAWGRTLEVTGKRMDSTRNAKLWWEDTKYPKGSVAKPLSIAVWSSPTYGHVAFVEQVKANGNIVINEANWDTFKKTNYGGGYDGAPKELTPAQIRARGDAVLLGYIYIADSSEMPGQDPNIVAQPVSRERFIGGLLKAFPSLPSNNSASIEQSARSIGLIVGGLDGNTNIVRGDAAKIIFRLIQATDKTIPANPDPNHYANDSALNADLEAKAAASALFAAGIAGGELHQARDQGFEFHPRRQLSVTESDLIQSRTLQLLQGSKLRAGSAVTITQAQLSAPAMVGQVANFELVGTNLSAATPPRVSLAGCDAPTLSVISAASARFACTPRAVGAARLFWKLPGTDTREFELGQFTVQLASADGMRFVSDAPVDDTQVDGGARITKTWTLANSGSTTWSTAYCLRPTSGAALAAGPVCPGASVRPGESFAFSTSMLMPAAQASQAMVKQSWALTNAASAQVGSVVWAQFQVKALPGRHEPPAAINCPVRNTGWTWANNSSLHAPGRGVGGADDSFALDYNRNTPSFDADAGQPVYAVADGTVYQGNGWGGNSVGQILINHTEADGTPWSSGYLHMRSKTTATTVRRGDQIGVVGNVGVPDGNNHLHFAAYRGHNGVVSVARTPSCNAASLVDGMQFVSDTPADNQLVDGGARFSKSWTLSNSGSSTWSTGYCLRPLAGTPIGSGEVCPTAPVAPGQRFTFSTTLAMPAAGPAQVQVKQTWALRNAAGAQVGPEVWAQFQVKAGGGGGGGGGGGFAIVEPFAMPAAVRAKTDMWLGAVNLSKAATQVRLVLVDPLGNTSSLPWTQAAVARWTLQHTFTQAGSFRWTLEARDAAGAVDQRTGLVQVSAEAPPAPLNPVLSKTDSVRALVPWSASLTTAAPVYQANLVFSNGRRIPLYGDQTRWETRNENCVFSEPGAFPYQLQLQRSQADPKIESFPGGTLLVQAQIVPVNPATVTSLPTTEQGQPYNLTVTTAEAADRVAVKWPDSAGEQGLQATNPARTQWAYGNRLFMQPGAVAFTVRSYKDGFTTATGEVTGSLQVTVPSASMRLVSISGNIVKSERPLFVVAASLAVDKVTVQLGSQPAVTLSALGPSGAEQSHRGQVLAAQPGTVPYVITAFNAQGQLVGAPIKGNVPVVDPTDSLVVASPVPAEVQRGQVSNWQFRTQAAPDEMWLAVAAPIGKLPLTGYFLNHTFNYPAGDYVYQLMRRDYLGNVFAIQGAAGTLRMRDVVAKPPSIKAMVANPATVKLGQAINFGVSLSQAVPVQRADISFLDVNVTEPLSATAADSYGRAHTMTAVGANRPYRMSVVLADGTRLAQDGVYTVQPPDVPPPLLLPVITSVRALPAVGKVGQQLNFVVTATNPGSVARVELVFPDAGNLTEPMAQQSADTWVRSRPMAQAGVNRPALVRLLLKDGRVVQAGLTYTVQP